jgi:hypothetical protein
MKNPLMSAWLSAANKASGPLRGAFMAEAQRRQKAMFDQWTKTWTAGLAGALPKATPKRRTRKK